MLEPRHNERPGDWLNWFAIKRFPYIEAFFVRHIEVFVAWDQAPHCGKKGEKSALAKKKKKIGERSEPIGSLGPPFPPSQDTARLASLPDIFLLDPVGY